MVGALGRWKVSGKRPGEEHAHFTPA